MSDIENQDFFMKLVAKGLRNGHLSFTELNALVPPEFTQEDTIEDILSTLESHGIMITENELENDLLNNPEEENVNDEHLDEMDLDETQDALVDDDKILDEALDDSEEEDMDDELDETGLDTDIPDIAGFASIPASHHALDEMDDSKIIGDHDDELDEELDEEDLEDEEVEIDKGYDKENLSSFDEVSGYDSRESLIDIDDDSDTESPRESASRKSGILGSDKADSSVDDPIRLYLREIGRENLLNAEQEVELSKKMEEGAQIIKDVILQSGVMISSFHDIFDTMNTRFDEEELEFSPKELKEKMNDQKRYVQFYRETLKEIGTPLKNYIELKKKTIASGGEVLNDDGFAKKRIVLLKKLSKIELQPEEISGFTDKYLSAE
ncbi:MAG: hypothetical protein CVV52_18655, partial [Spirochaetae bacterium HGW-Spirochaetae-8]